VPTDTLVNQIFDGGFVTQLHGVAAEYRSPIGDDFMPGAFQLGEGSTGEYELCAQAGQFVGDAAPQTTPAASHENGL
jgi:hypothetical protein